MINDYDMQSIIKNLLSIKKNTARVYGYTLYKSYYWPRYLWRIVIFCVIKSDEKGKKIFCKKQTKGVFFLLKC